MSVVLVEKEEGIGLITLNRPHVLNALSRDLCDALANAFEDFRNDPDMGVVIITGAGRAFCSGMDLKELAYAESQSDSFGDHPVWRVMQLMEELDRPIIAAINGVAATGGFELALACDIRYASPHAQFADTHARMGALPGWGLSQKLSRLIGLGRAMEISLTGNYISAQIAEAWGLVNRVVPHEELLPTCQALARDVLSCVPEAVRDYKQLILQGHNTTLAEGMKMEAEVLSYYRDRISREELIVRREAVLARGRKQKLK